MLYWLMKYVVVGPFLWVTGRPTFEGREHVPATGPALLVGNHLSVADWLVMPFVVPRRVYFLAKSDYYTGTGVRGTLSRWFFEWTGQHPIDRTNADSAQVAMDAGLEVLRAGKLLCIYPEGTRSPDGRLYRGKTGLARLALRAGVPLIPVGVTGTDRYLHQDRRFPRPAKLTVRMSAPLDLSPWADRIGDRTAEREITDEVMRRIQALTGQQYVPDTYGADEKKRLEALRTDDGAHGDRRSDGQH